MKQRNNFLLAGLLALAAVPALAVEASGVVSTVKHDAKTAGHEIAAGAKHVGHAVAKGATEAGHAVASGAKAAGQAIKHGAKAVGHGVVEGVDTVKQKLDPSATQPAAPVEQGNQ
ncbi:MAG: hypothetical protein JO171_12565 [Paludibacterium sp.]|uniref:hypothetical protein n=1 Tax=Paludibacterium sp. TaxID=1917523 RepID=UPI0025F7819B|nr:hypothetical protein [Paludibacterium sp.]MBV8047985.1 hypothetical protein [Paludibacterium sp.]MBV8649153.1 hypothetical protein [Paludibacterium sp.]